MNTIINQSDKTTDGLGYSMVVANTDEKFVLVTPPRTASTLSHMIAPKLGFKTYKIDGKNLLKLSETSIHNHFYNLFESHEEYSFITTLRNPYQLMVSFFKFGNPYNDDLSVEAFEKFLHSHFYGKTEFMKYFDCYDYSIRIPDYIIRVESMFDDYMKLPFTSRTNYYKSGELFKDCQIKVNPSKENGLDWYSYYNSNIADIVYYNFINVFELGGYHKDSWKK